MIKTGRDSNLVVAGYVSFTSAPCNPCLARSLFHSAALLSRMINQEGIRKDAFLIWPAGRDSNPRSPESESGALSGYATGGNICNYYITKNNFFNILSPKSIFTGYYERPATC